MNTYDFVRIGPVSGQKQTHRNEKQAPCRRGIWCLPKVAGNDVFYLGSQWYSSEVEDEKQYIKKNNLYKNIKLKMTDTVWHHMNGYWEECSVRDYYKRLNRMLHNVKACIDGEHIEVFIKM